jgi:endonuclease YncB( thermonuclease family)
MPFVLIKGIYTPNAGTPDGDSLRFLADDLSLWKKLEGAPVELGAGAQTKNTVQLRLEGIDALEKGAIEPLASQARDNLLRRVGVEVQRTPQPRGYVLARMTDDKTRRPIAFAFAGNTARPDGASITLEAPLLRKSANYLQLQDGLAYPLYYNTLFASLREEFNSAVAQAQFNKRGYWPSDKTQAGVRVTGRESLKTIAPIWPKLWRRLDEYLRNNTSLEGFIAALEKKNERLDILSLMEERGLQDIVQVRGSTVRLLFAPEDIRVVGQAGLRAR